MQTPKEDNIIRLRKFYESNGRPAELFAIIQEYERERNQMSIEFQRLLRKVDLGKE